MKRSEINQLITETMEFFAKRKFSLPPFATFTPNDWVAHADDAREIFDLALGWDITDFGSGAFERTGLILFTLRNGKPNDNRYPKPYAEKIMMVQPNQTTPMHFHWNKTEDIINRGGGDLAIQLYAADKQEGPSKASFTVVLDGIQRSFPAGSWLKLKPGESITLTPYLYHTFHAERKSVMVGEVSMVNDDASDNRFLEDSARFPDMVEDVSPQYLLCTDYAKFIRGTNTNDLRKVT